VQIDIVHNSIDVPPLFSLTSSLPGRRKRLRNMTKVQVLTVAIENEGRSSREVARIQRNDALRRRGMLAPRFSYIMTRSRFLADISVLMNASLLATQRRWKRQFASLKFVHIFSAPGTCSERYSGRQDTLLSPKNRLQECESLLKNLMSGSAERRLGERSSFQVGTITVILHKLRLLHESRALALSKGCVMQKVLPKVRRVSHAPR
jgi:hypothetical protein